MRAIGLGLGAQMTMVSDTELWVLMERLGEGVAAGRLESTKAVMSMETKGRC
jgi:hypothetical protein